MVSEECSFVDSNCSTVKRNGAASGTLAQTSFHRFMDTDFAYCRGRSTRRGCLLTILCDSNLIFMVWYLLTGGLVLYVSSLRLILYFSNLSTYFMRPSLVLWRDIVLQLLRHYWAYYRGGRMQYFACCSVFGSRTYVHDQFAAYIVTRQSFSIGWAHQASWGEWPSND